MPLATGIVVHTGSNDYKMSAQKGYIAYADPKDPVNGQIYVGAVFPANVKEAKFIPFNLRLLAWRIPSHITTQIARSQA